MKKFALVICTVLMMLCATGVATYNIGLTPSYADDIIDSKEEFQKKLGVSDEKQDLEKSIPKTLFIIVSIAAGCVFPYFLLHIIKSGVNIAKNKKNSGGQSDGWDDFFAALKGAGITFGAWGILTMIYLFSQKIFDI